MNTQKIVNLLNASESSKFATRKWYLIKYQNKAEYDERNKNDSSIKFETNVIKSNLSDYLNAYIFVRGDITATGGNANTKVAFKSCAPFTRCVAHINNKHIDTAKNLNIIMPMYNLIEYSDNFFGNI